MRKKNTESVAASSAGWETLEAFARQSMQQLLQRMLQEEVAASSGAPATSGVIWSTLFRAIATASARYGA